jgi:hypothetical protein
VDASIRKAGSSDVLHDVERASVDELRALQLERLKWSLDHA